MARYERRTFRDQPVELDGNQYHSCIFINCEIIFRGSAAVALNRTSFNGCKWTFKDAAGTTVKFLTAIYQSGETGFVEAVFEQIRRGEESG